MKIVTITQKLHLHSMRIHEEEINNIGTARKRTATRATTEKRPPEQRRLSLYTQGKLKINASEND